MQSKSNLTLHQLGIYRYLLSDMLPFLKDYIDFSLLFFKGIFLHVFKIIFTVCLYVLNECIIPDDNFDGVCETDTCIPHFSLTILII